MVSNAVSPLATETPRHRVIRDIIYNHHSPQAAAATDKASLNVHDASLEEARPHPTKHGAQPLLLVKQPACSAPHSLTSVPCSVHFQTHDFHALDIYLPAEPPAQVRELVRPNVLAGSVC
jgi:hypothetical protein